MKVLFMGTPDFAVPTLEKLIEHHEVVAVVTQPDKPNGRGKKILFSPVKEKALANNIPLLQPQKVRTNEFFEELKSYDADVFVVVAYGRILPESILNLPKCGCLNIHGSLLPKYRGAAPIQWAVINGENITGVTIMYMDVGLDTGDIILQKEMKIEFDATSATVHDEMSVLGAETLIQALILIEQETVNRIKQDDSISTYAKPLTKEMGKIDFNKSTKEILDLIRGLNPWPTAYAIYGCDDFTVKIWKAEIYDNSTKYQNGEIVELLPNKGIVVQASDGCILITEIQATNSKRMKVSDYLRGHADAFSKIKNFS